MNQELLIVFAMVAALGLVGVVVAVNIILTTQEAEAKGCPLISPGANASKTRCVRT
jgi:hypothetical protein